MKSTHAGVRGKFDEEKALMDDFVDRVNASYGTDPHANFSHCTIRGSDVTTDYEPLKLSTFRVFCAHKGTVLADPVLWTEQLFILVVFASFAIPVYVHFKQDVSVGHGQEGDSMRKWIGEQEGRMREFAMIMTILASLLLSFYTAMAVGRWWVIRTAGIGGIKAAAMELELVISQMVTQDEQVLSAIRRYARSSLTLVFLWRRQGQTLQTIRQYLLDHDLCTNEEVNKLQTWNHCLHETIWAWQSAIVCMLWREGKIKSDQNLRYLLERVSDGRKAIQVIHTHLAVRIPMQYVHLLGLLVKMHNFVLSVLMGSLFGAAVRNGETIICVQLAGRTLLLPLLFNAILLINAGLADPFSGSAEDFPGAKYQAALEADGSAFVKAGQNMPDWMARRNPLPV